MGGEGWNFQQNSHSTLGSLTKGLNTITWIGSIKTFFCLHACPITQACLHIRRQPWGGCWSPTVLTILKPVDSSTTMRSSSPSFFLPPPSLTPSHCFYWPRGFLHQMPRGFWGEVPFQWGTFQSRIKLSPVKSLPHSAIVPVYRPVGWYRQLKFVGQYQKSSIVGGAEGCSN